MVDVLHGCYTAQSPDTAKKDIQKKKGRGAPEVGKSDKQGSRIVNSVGKG